MKPHKRKRDNGILLVPWEILMIIPLYGYLFRKNSHCSLKKKKIDLLLCGFYFVINRNDVDDMAHEILNKYSLKWRAIVETEMVPRLDGPYHSSRGVHALRDNGTYCLTEDVIVLTSNFCEDYICFISFIDITCIHLQSTLLCQKNK